MANQGAGPLDKKVAWDKRVAANDGYGNPIAPAFAEQFQCRAGFTFLRGGEAVMAARLQGRQPIVVRIRASIAARLIEPDWQMRNVRTGEAYAVRSVAEVAGRRWLDVTVESGVPA